MSRQSKPISLRDREIREILDEDLKYYRQVLEREFRQTRLMSEVYAPPNLQEKQVAFNIDRYFLKLQEESDKLLNGLIAGTPEDAQKLFSVYQELITYLQTYAKYGSLGQRDLAVLENKFDAIAPQIEQIATASADRRLKDASLLQQLSSILDNKHYVLLRGASVSIPEQVAPARETFRQRVERERERTLPPESESEPQPLANLFRSTSARERMPAASDTVASRAQAPPDSDIETPEMVQAELEVAAMPKMLPRRQWDAPAQIYPKLKNRTQGQAYLKSIDKKELKKLFKELGIDKELKETKGKNTAGAPSRAKLNQMFRVYNLRELGILTIPDSPAAQREELAQAAEPPVVPEDQEELIDYGNQDSEYPQSEMEGDGRRSHGLKIGAGEAEDLMFGRPAGVKKAMFLRPMDRRPVHFKTADQRKEVGLSLDDRMSFLNQLDSKPVKDEFKINSIHTYKKAMSEKAKQLEKMKK
jgi:hypothetical protein